MILFPVFSPGTSEKARWQREHHMLAKYISYQGISRVKPALKEQLAHSVISHQTAPARWAIHLAQAFCCSAFQHLFQCLSSPCFKQMYCRCLVLWTTGTWQRQEQRPPNDRGAAKAAIGGFRMDSVHWTWNEIFTHTPIPCPPLNLRFSPSDLREWWRTVIGMETEVRPPQKHVAWVFSKDLSLTYAIKWEDTLIGSSFVPRTTWYKTGHGGTQCVVMIVASQTRSWPGNDSKETFLG